RTVCLELRCPLPHRCSLDDPEARETVAWFRARLEKGLLGFMKGAGVEPERLVLSPQPEGPECQSYCPRCHDQYVLPAGTCFTCIGVPLRRFGALPAPGAPAPTPYEGPGVAPKAKSPPPACGLAGGGVYAGLLSTLPDLG